MRAVRMGVLGGGAALVNNCRRGIECAGHFLEVRTLDAMKGKSKDSHSSIHGNQESTVHMEVLEL